MGCKPPIGSARKPAESYNSVADCNIKGPCRALGCPGQASYALDPT